MSEHGCLLRTRRAALLFARFAAVLAAALALAAPAHAQQVFNGDPVDSATSRPYPLLPGVPLILPGPDERFETADDVINTGITGDVDLVVRIGTIPSGPIPAPTWAAGGPAPRTTTAGGGSSGQGDETPFTVLVSNGTGSPPYGTTITASDLDQRPVTVYAFPDLDGDGILGPTNTDGSTDNPFEQQEAQAYAGRQVGQLSAGRLAGSIGVHVAAPASLGGLRIALVAGVYTGSDANAVFSDGTPIFTLWPFFPPLDPERVIDSGNPPPPNPDQPIGLQFDIERNYLPAPGHPSFGTPFAVPVSGSEPTTDQFVSISGPAHAARFFDAPLASKYRSRSRSSLVPAPDESGAQRVLVVPLTHVRLAATPGAARTVRLLPIDLLGNVADPSAPGMAVTVQAIGTVSIAAPDTDADPTIEALVLDEARGVTLTLETDGTPGDARLDLTSGARPLEALAVTIGGSGDRDADARADEGNMSTIEGDKPCTPDDGFGFACDDNCPLTRNADQSDKDQDGLGDCCDGTCVDDPTVSDCAQCVFVGPPSIGGGTVLVLENLRVRVKPGDTPAPDRLTLKAQLAPLANTVLQPASEPVSVDVRQGTDVAYVGTLPGVPALDSTRPKYRYDDPDAQIDGVTRVMLQTLASGKLRLQWKAEAVGLAAALSNGATHLSVRIGDDSFNGAVQCTVRSTTSCRD